MSKGSYNFTEQEAKYRTMTDEQLAAARIDIRASLASCLKEDEGWYFDDACAVHLEQARRLKARKVATTTRGACSKKMKAAAAREEAMLISSGLEYIGNYDAAELEDGLHVVDDQLVRINSGNPEPLDGNDLAVFDAMLDALRSASICLRHEVSKSERRDAAAMIDSAIEQAEAIR